LPFAIVSDDFLRLRFSQYWAIKFQVSTVQLCFTRRTVLAENFLVSLALETCAYGDTRPVWPLQHVALLGNDILQIITKLSISAGEMYSKTCVKLAADQFGVGLT